MRESKQSDERRQEFMDAAEKLFKKNGIVDTTVNNIVKELDVAKGLFYYYFKSKDDVINAISEKYNEAFRECMHANEEDVHSWEDRFDTFTENCVNSFRQMKEYLKAENEDVNLSELAFKSLEEAREASQQVLKDLLKEGNELGKINIEDIDYYADLLTGGISYLVLRGKTNIIKIKQMTKDLLQQGKDNNHE